MAKAGSWPACRRCGRRRDPGRLCPGCGAEPGPWRVRVNGVWFTVHRGGRDVRRRWAGVAVGLVCVAAAAAAVALLAGLTVGRLLG